MSLGAQPNSGHLIERLDTSQRSCAFYLTWFFKLYRCGDTGWHNVQTPDGRSIIEQDNFFWVALENIGRKLNEIRAHEIWKQQQKSGR